MSDDVVKNLEDAINKQIPEAIYRAMEKACLIVVSDAKRGCPVDDGQLRNSIEYQIEQSSSKGIDDVVGYVGSNVEYAPYVEKGTGIYSAEGRKTPWSYQDAKGEWHKTSGMKAQPFLQPAIDNNRDSIANCFRGIV